MKTFKNNKEESLNKVNISFINQKNLTSGKINTHFNAVLPTYNAPNPPG